MQLSFCFRFPKKDDEVFCAYTLPYTYSALQAHLKHLKLLASDYPYEFIRFESFGTSLGQIDIPIIKISNKNLETDSYDEKPVIVIIGR